MLNEVHACVKLENQRLKLQFKLQNTDCPHEIKNIKANIARLQIKIDTHHTNIKEKLS